MLFRKIAQQDTDQVDQLFRASITDIVIREQIDDPFLVEKEVERLNTTVRESLSTINNCFFVAEMKERVVGTIALTKPNSLISDHIHTETNIYEIGCVYVHPDYQKRGIGKFMFRCIKEELIHHGHEKYYLDAGFPSSQKYWLHVLGEPSYILDNYWGEGAHHFIWLESVR